MVAVTSIAATTAEHNTTDYPADILVVRRGQSLNLSTYSPGVTITPVSASPGGRGRPNGPALRLQRDEPVSGWALTAPPSAPGTATLAIPATAPVGLYNLDDRSGAPPLELAVVFNPFLPADPVHMPDARARAEYLFNETGLIWRGSADSNFPAPWDYAQFDRAVVLAALWLLDPLEHASRGDIVAVTRHLSAVVNSNDEGGVIVGRWDGEYDDGAPPSRWAGSQAVLAQFYDTARPVKYGQCWVFAGVLASVCRALGIPTRVTSNFSSAHDTTRPYNRAVDLYYDRAGDMIDDKSSDSIWNFHVWCAAWMTRADLAGPAAQFGFSMDGWQAIDATPQELSEGVFKMGPSPLSAIKRGYAVDYDTDFVIGEVNADVVYYWQDDDDDDKFVVRNKRTRSIGRYTSTKAVGSNRRNDVTLEYKFPEGSPEERAALANRSKPSDDIDPIVEPTGVEFSQAFDARVRFGDDIRVVVSARNTGSADATVRLASLARAIRYTGTPTSTIDRKVESLTVAPGATAELVVTLTEAEYTSHLVRDVQTIKFNNSARVAASGQSWADECIVRVYGDDALAVSAPRTVNVGDTAVAQATVTNSFRVPLTNVVVSAEGRGLADMTTVSLGEIAPGESKVADIRLRPSVRGDRTLVVTLDTDELQDIIKSVEVTVIDPDRMNWFERLFAGFRGFFR